MPDIHRVIKEPLAQEGSDANESGKLKTLVEQNVKPPRPKRQLSPEQIKVLKERLVKARENKSKKRQELISSGKIVPKLKKTKTVA